jgi:hypothetical protein
VTRGWYTAAMFRLALPLLAFASAAACAEDRCTTSPSGDDTAPVIEQFDLLGQLEGDPWTLVFGTSFADSSGDLGGGHAEFSLNGKSSGSQLELDEIFRQSGIDPASKAGRMAFPLRFADSVQDGSEVWLGLQLVDAEDQRSNCSAMKLHFAVEPVSAWFRDAGKRLATWWSSGPGDRT